ncbi:hypothetical protein QR680_002013 [Steinernema hermaphroditum]|uniref:Uncharacterized protein n=1 Tax=Steinernema hermaphroditum TaxID=289476 RepID=A0AA39H0V6_9BILA|nr:hypothetical protein QR680_002013 [Steinernema hermaphroditum]
MKKTTRLCRPPSALAVWTPSSYGLLDVGIEDLAVEFKSCRQRYMDAGGQHHNCLRERTDDLAESMTISPAFWKECPEK